MLVSLKLTAKNALVGDFPVRRALPQVQRRLVGPFCFLDHMGPHVSTGSPGGGVGPHPHIGLATVTYLFEGSALHRDSLGNAQLITPGDVNWMLAARGIVHSERTPPNLVGQSHRFHGLQVWVALPLNAEEAAPSFQHVPRDELPKFSEGRTTLTVVLGDWQGARSRVSLASPTFYVVADLEPGSTLALPTQYTERALYVVEGTVQLDGTTLSSGELGVLSPGVAGAATAVQKSRIALVGGEPLDGPRFMWWNFVSSRKERLEQAKADWRHRRFPLIPGDSDTLVPMPGESEPTLT